VPYLPELVRSMAEAYPQGLADMSHRALQEMARQYQQPMDSLRGKRTHITDKMLGNFMHLGLISRLFPAAHVVHCERDPVDTCLSCYFQNFAARLDYAYGLDDLAHFYQQYRRLMQHWQQVLALPMTTLRYEELVTDQEPATRRLLDFLGLEWDAACLHFHLNTRPVITASYEQVRRPLYGGSVRRWQHYRAHLGPLLQAFPPGGED
jgi:hypothetical protein